MAKRDDDALFIASGACNPSGIALAIVAACREARAEPDHAGTDALCADPAIKLMVHQLAFICGIVSGAEEFYKAPYYSESSEACRKGAAEYTKKTLGLVQVPAQP